MLLLVATGAPAGKGGFGAKERRGRPAEEGNIPPNPNSLQAGSFLYASSLVPTEVDMLRPFGEQHHARQFRASYPVESGRARNETFVAVGGRNAQDLFSVSELAYCHGCNSQGKG